MDEMSGGLGHEDNPLEQAAELLPEYASFLPTGCYVLIPVHAGMPELGSESRSECGVVAVLDDEVLFGSHLIPALDKVHARLVRETFKDKPVQRRFSLVVTGEPLDSPALMELADVIAEMSGGRRPDIVSVDPGATYAIGALFPREFQRQFELMHSRTPRWWPRAMRHKFRVPGTHYARSGTVAELAATESQMLRIESPEG